MSSDHGSGALRPIYLCMDTSSSAWREAARVREITQVLIRELRHSRQRRQIRLSVIAFSNDVVPLMGLTALEEQERVTDRLPNTGLSRQTGGTSFAALFRYLRRRIDTDVRQFQADGLAVHQPGVCLVSDGRATDDWVVEHRELVSYDVEDDTGFASYPEIAVIAIGRYDRESLRRMVMPTSRRAVILPGRDLDPTLLVGLLIGQSRPILPELSEWY